MTNLLYSKRVVILICILAAIVLILSFVSLNIKPPVSNKPPTFTVSPAAGSTLPLQSPVMLFLSASKPIPSSYKISLIQHVVGTTSTSQADFSSRVAPSGQSAVFTIISVTPNTIYTITVTNPPSNNPLFEASFITSQEAPTPVPANNLVLSKYLPYETTNYILRYDSSQNLYIFELKLDPASSASSDAQFDQAKTDAINFIKSKGVDPSTIIIDWRRT